MATYIAISKSNLSSLGVTASRLYYVVNPSIASYALTLVNSSWSNNGTTYAVYLVGLKSSNYSIEGKYFVHTYNDSSIKSVSSLPINSKIVWYAPTGSSVGTFPGIGSTYPSGTLYYFNVTETKKPTNKWFSEDGINPGRVDGIPYTYYNTNQSTATTGKCTDSKFSPTSSSDGVSIVELYHSTNGVANATNLYTSIINRDEKTLSNWTKGTYKNWIYDYSNTANTTSSNPARINGTGRKVFAIHNTTGGDCNLAIAYGGNTPTSLSNTNYTIGAFGYTKVSYNTWAYHNTTDGNHYYSITVNENNKFVGTDLLLASGAYTIKIHTYSEAGFDGIIISTTSLSSGSLSSSSTDGITRCSGVDKTVEYKLEYSSLARTLYIYFKTDSSTLTGPGGFDSVGTSISTSKYSTGDIEISRASTYTITFKANGGTGGTTSTKVIVGESLDLSTITKPTRDGWDFYKWAIDVNSFKFVSSPYKPTGNVTLYAVWDNFPKFTELSNKSVYCTDDCIAASSTQGSKSIKLFSGAGMTCSAGTVTYAADKSRVYPKDSPTSPISGATIQPVGTDNNVTVPEGTPAGDYIASIVVYTSLSPKTPGSYYGPHSAQPAEYKIQFTIKATTLTYGPVLYMTYTPDGELTNGNITQQKKFPASQFTISPSTIGDYFKTYGVFKQAVSCNNGTQREGNVTVHGWSPMSSSFRDIVVPSLGTTISDEYTYTFANGISEALVFIARGEGGKAYERLVLSGVREANALTGISLSLGSNPINYNSTTTATVTAKYTSGSSKDVTDSLSTSSSATSNYIKSGDTSVVTIS